MKKTVRRIVPTAVAFTAGTVLAGVFFPGVAASFASTQTTAVTSQSQQVNLAAQRQATDASQAALLAAKSVHLAAVTAKNAATPPAPATTQDVSIGGTTGRLWYKKISTRKLWVDGSDTGWIARYDVQVRRADGKVIFDQNLSVYRLAWFVNEFKVGKKYGSESAIVAALNSASSVSEADARAAFKKSIGSLGEFRTTGGDTQKPYDPSQHPGHPYIPLDYKG